MSAEDGYNNYTWTNFHKNISCVAEKYYDVWNRDHAGNAVHDPVENWRNGLRNVCDIISEAETNHKKISCVGGRWSLSGVAMNEGNFMLNTKPLDIAFIGLAKEDIVASKNGEHLVLTQCGVSVSQLNEWLFRKNLALPTSGASDGQTIAGAVSTGTHGAAVSAGSMPDYAIGIHMLVSATESFWIEGNEKILSDEAVKKFCGEDAVRINDNNILNSAVVAFGSFGIVFSMLLECEPLYQLKLYQRYFTLPQLETCITNPRALSGLGWEDNPHHFELIFNPYKTDRVIGRAMYKLPYRVTKEAAAIVLYSWGLDLFSLIGEVAEKIPQKIGKLMTFLDDLIKKQYEEIPEGIVNFPGRFFTSEVTSLKGRGMSIELGVDVNDARRSLDVVLEVAKKEAIPGVVAFRYVKKSKALFSMARFDTTCTIEIPASFSEQTLRFYEELWRELDRIGINYTFHWGQMNDLDHEKIVRKWGAENVNTWLNARRTLLKTEQQRKMFSNDFLIRCGLDT